jgi:excisionase family DNA binding protein
MRHKKSEPKPVVPAALPLPKLTFTIEEAAEILGIGRNRALMLVQDGRLRKLAGCGRRVVIPAVAIDPFLLGE